MTECRLAIQQTEVKNKTLQERIDEAEKTKRELEQQVRMNSLFFVDIINSNSINTLIPLGMIVRWTL